MGTSGNNPGYKIFSISTTIRNPKRNYEFLEILKDFDGEELTKDIKDQIYYEIISKGIYKCSNLDNAIKDKYNSGQVLTDDEVQKIIQDNPQKTGDEGRLMTQIRCIKDTGFLSLTGSKKSPKMKINKLGYDLINGMNVEDVYTKAMVGLHANNPQRSTIYNKSIPFLNTIFVIKSINDYYKNNNGILWHEFAFFILSMKSCDYESATKKIIEYRQKFGLKENKRFLENYIYNELNISKIAYSSIIKDYADDVYRKFNMTGLLEKHGFGKYTYIRFSEYNSTKINLILNAYKNYKFKIFSNSDEYVEYLSNIFLPWEKSIDAKKELVETKEKVLGIKTNENFSLDKRIKELDQIHNKRIFDNSINKYSFDLIEKELIILSRNKGNNSKFDDIPEPIRLEWLIAIITAKKYGSKYVKPNLILDETGLPKSFAPGGVADIEFNTEGMYCLLEVTMIRDYKQQLNSETTSISDHLESLNTDKEKYSILIAPRIHNRVASYFVYTTVSTNIMILATTIEKYLDYIEDSLTINDFSQSIKSENENMCQNVNDYCDKINNYKLSTDVVV